MATKKQTEKNRMPPETKRERSKTPTHTEDPEFMTTEDFEMIGTGNRDRDQRESAELWE